MANLHCYVSSRVSTVRGYYERFLGTIVGIHPSFPATTRQHVDGASVRCIRVPQRESTRFEFEATQHSSPSTAKFARPPCGWKNAAHSLVATYVVWRWLLKIMGLRGA